MAKNILLIILATCCLAFTAPIQAQAQDVWVFSMAGANNENGSSMEDIYVDTDTLSWKSPNEFCVELKKVLQGTDETAGKLSFRFYRQGDTGLWLVSLPTGNPVKEHVMPAYTMPLTKAVLDTCYCEKAAAEDYTPQTADVIFSQIGQRLARMEGTWYDEKGYSVNIRDMTLNGYPILNVYDPIGGDPGSASIIIRQPHGCRAAEICWQSAEIEHTSPFFEIDGVRYYR